MCVLHGDILSVANLDGFKCKTGVSARIVLTRVGDDTKPDRVLEAVSSEDGGLDEFWGSIHYPKANAWTVCGCHGLRRGRSNWRHQ